MIELGYIQCRVNTYSVFKFDSQYISSDVKPLTNPGQLGYIFSNPMGNSVDYFPCVILFNFSIFVQTEYRYEKTDSRKVER